jgi:hypothetical protein
VLHGLSVNQENERVSHAKHILTALTKHKPIDFEQVITGDESWFFLHYPHDSVWASSRDDLLHRTKHTINAEKWLVSIFWSVNGIHSLLHGPKGPAHNTAFFTDAIMPSLIQNITSTSHQKTWKG